MPKKIYVGTAGVPICCNHSDIRGAISCVHELGLDALEIEFVRGIFLKEKEAKTIGKEARKHNILLSVHAPYYINLASRKEKIIKASMLRIYKSALLGSLMGAKVVVIHPGYYSKRTPEETYSIIFNNLKTLREELTAGGMENILLGIEVTGRYHQFGRLEEVLRICNELEDSTPVLDFAHIHALTKGGLRRREDFGRVFDKVERVLGEIHYHIHVSCVEYGKSGEKHHLPFSALEPDYKLLAEEMGERNIEATVISESPELENDALKFRKYFLAQIQ